MPGKKYSLKADISTANPEGVEAILEAIPGVNAFTKIDKGFQVKAAKTGESARELNRTFLSALRRVQKKTILRAERTHGRTTEPFFDFVPKGIKKV